MSELITKPVETILASLPSKQLWSDHNQTLTVANDDTLAGTYLRERRGGTRHPVQKTVLVVPVRPDGTPDWEHRQTAVLRDISEGGVGLTCPHGPAWQTDALVLLVRGEHGAMRCAGLEVRHQRALEDGRRQVGARFGGFAADLLRPENLMPRLRPQALQFEKGVADEVIARWAEAGLLQVVWRDQVQVCPRCHCLPTFRLGCANCGSVNLVNDTLLHHFACAHVGLAADFENPTGELTCPKCRQRPLIVGTDFERRFPRNPACHIMNTLQVGKGNNAILKPRDQHSHPVQRLLTQNRIVARHRGRGSV
jgi:hypothetical protein